jgi:N-acetylglucosaminyldiphosphoundecaprenol N-acetyl-beta-D-mannosaminyltransferase
MPAMMKMGTTAERLPKKRVINVDISVGTFEQHLQAFADLGAGHVSSYVCCVNVHMAVECHKDPAFARVVNEADIATADGMPILRSLQLFHRRPQERVAGNDILPALMTRAAASGLSVYLYGGTDDVQQRIIQRAARELPDLKFAGVHAPPFAPLEAMDLEAEAQRINASGAHIVLVSLGCPKQERWMAAMRGRVHAVMLGVGGAFLLYAGVDTRAPKWMRDLSMEWLYRLWLEPGRLWKRYLVTNSIFMVLFLGRLVAWPFSGPGRVQGNERTRG